MMLTQKGCQTNHNQFLHARSSFFINNFFTLNKNKCINFISNNQDPTIIHSPTGGMLYPSHSLDSLNTSPYNVLVNRYTFQQNSCQVTSPIVANTEGKKVICADLICDIAKGQGQLTNLYSMQCFIQLKIYLVKAQTCLFDSLTNSNTHN